MAAWRSCSNIQIGYKKSWYTKQDGNGAQQKDSSTIGFRRVGTKVKQFQKPYLLPHQRREQFVNSLCSKGETKGLTPRRKQAPEDFKTFDDGGHEGKVTQQNGKSIN